MTLLRASGISKRFGGLQALSDVSLAVEAGEVVGIVGPNGAGKTTLFDCLLGTLRPDAGSVVFDGVRLDRLPTFRRARLGIGRTFQRLELFAGMTPRQHVLVALRSRRPGAWLRDLVGPGHAGGGEAEEAARLLELVGLEDVADLPVEALSLGSGRLVELARALAGHPKLLMLDEPSSGLADVERARVVSVIDRAGHEEGMAVLMVEHDLETVAAVCARLVVLDFGRRIADGPIDDVLEDAGVRRAYLGEVESR